jgi:hypothetical protein
MAKAKKTTGKKKAATKKKTGAKKASKPKAIKLGGIPTKGQ